MSRPSSTINPGQAHRWTRWIQDNVLRNHRDRIRTQQTRDIAPMLIQCWAGVVDGGPILNQHWCNVSCLLGRTQQKRGIGPNDMVPREPKWLAMYWRRKRRNIWGNIPEISLNIRWCIRGKIRGLFCVTSADFAKCKEVNDSKILLVDVTF